MYTTVGKGTPCSYGGVVYADNSTTLRVWRPEESTGAALCIGSQMGQGINSQATNRVNIVITVWSWRTTTSHLQLCKLSSMLQVRSI